MDDTLRDSRQLFERLCLLRSLYERRGPRDDAGVISLEDMVRAVARAMADAPAPEATTTS